MPGVHHARSLVCSGRKHTRSSPQARRIIRHSLRDGVTASFALSLVIGLCCHHPRRNALTLSPR